MHKTTLAVSATIALALGLTGCGSSTSAGTDPSSHSGPARPRAFDTGQLAKVQDCLKAAGLAQNLPSGPPSGMPSGIPSDMPTNPSGPPSGMPTGGPQGGFGQMNDPQVRDALKACGIELPQPGAATPPS